MNNTRKVTVLNSEDGVPRIVTVKSAGSLLIKGKSPIVKEIKDEKGDITSIKYMNTAPIELGQQIHVGKFIYKINEITKNSLDNPKNDKDQEHSYLLKSTTKKTRSSYFLMPLLGKRKGDWYWNSLFVNCFIRTEDNPDEDFIYLLYRYTDDLRGFDGQIKSHYMYHSEEDVDFQHILYKFKIPKEYEEIVNQFHNGKYSKFDQDYMEQICYFHERKSYVEDILFKNDRRKKKIEEDLGVELSPDMEYEGIRDLKEETYWNKYRIIKTFDPKRIHNLN